VSNSPFTAIGDKGCLAQSCRYDPNLRLPYPSGLVLLGEGILLLCITALYLRMRAGQAALRRADVSIETFIRYHVDPAPT